MPEEILHSEVRKEKCKNQVLNPVSNYCEHCSITLPYLTLIIVWLFSVCTANEPLSVEFTQGDESRHTQYEANPTYIYSS